MFLEESKYLFGFDFVEIAQDNAGKENSYNKNSADQQFLGGEQYDQYQRQDNYQQTDILAQEDIKPRKAMSFV